MKDIIHVQYVHIDSDPSTFFVQTNILVVSHFTQTERIESNICKNDGFHI